MAPRAATPSIRLISTERGEPRVISNGVLGMSLFVLTEIMVFGGMISAFNVVRASAPVWPPPGQPRLPIEETAINTLALLASGVCMILAQRRFAESRSAARLPLTFALVLASFFVVFQGWEWLSLIAEGLTMTSSALGSFFYLIVGMHALHVVVAIGLLFQTWRRHARGWLQHSQLATTAVFWYFVVGAWPLIYWRVYL